MPTYLWTARDRQGNKTALRIEAATTEQARNELLQQGYTDLQLQTDDLASGLQVHSSPECVVSAQDQVRFLNEGKFTIGEVFWKNFRDFGVLYILLVGAALWSYFSGLLVLGISLSVCIPVLFVWRSAILLQGLYMEQLFAAKEWHRWDRMLRVVSRMERYSRIMKLKQPEIANYKAQAKAGLGDLDGALREIRRFESDSRTPRWLYLIHLAMVYDAARDFDKALELSQQAVAEGPPSGSLNLSLAERLILRKRDVVKAKAALARAESLDLPQLAQPFVPLCKGMIEFECGNNELASQLLEEALGKLQRLSHHSMIGSAIRLAKTYLCLACAARGDRKAGERYFAEVRDYLIATREQEVLQRCEQSLRRN